MPIKIRDAKVFRALLEVPYHPTLIALALWVAYRNNDPEITSAYREKPVHDKDSGIHSTLPCRALDWKSSHLTDPQRVADDINDHWEYDASRPRLKCAVYHDVGLGAHIHTQVCEKTKYFPEGRGPINA